MFVGRSGDCKSFKIRHRSPSAFDGRPLARARAEETASTCAAAIIYITFRSRRQSRDRQTEFLQITYQR